MKVITRSAVLRSSLRMSVIVPVKPKLSLSWRVSTHSVRKWVTVNGWPHVHKGESSFLKIWECVDIPCPILRRVRTTCSLRLSRRGDIPERTLDLIHLNVLDKGMDNHSDPHNAKVSSFVKHFKSPIGTPYSLKPSSNAS